MSVRRRVMFSSRTPAVLDANALAQLTEERRAAGVALLDLTAANPTTAELPGAAAWRTAIGAALAAGAEQAYEPQPRGLPAARIAIAAELGRRGVRLDADHVVLTASTSEACTFLFKLLCDPGDEVLAPRPSYPLFEHLAALDAVALRGYPEGEVPALGPRSRAIIVVSPGNPTGAVLDAAGLAALDAACADAGCALIGDEVFADHVHDPDTAARMVSVAAAERALSFALGGLSKTAGMPHLKLGWIAVAGPAPLRDEALARLDLIADTYLSVATPVQAALPRLLAIGAEVRAAIRARVGENRAALTASGLAATPVQAGWSALLALPRGLDGENAAATLLAEDGVQVYPGYFFDIERDDCIVVSLLPPPQRFAEALARIAARLALAVTAARGG